MRHRMSKALQVAVLLLSVAGCGTMDWSPDGKKIVAAWPSVGSHTVLRVVDLQSGLSRALPDSRDGLCPKWSPDARWIAFTREVAGSRQAHVYDVQKGKTTVIPDTREVTAFVWREDSARLLVCTTGTARCYAMQGAVPTWEAELPSALLVAEGAWIPDTDSVVLFSIGPSTGGNLWLIEGAEVTRITTTDDVLGFGVRPGGKEIIWARASRNPRYILITLYAMPLKERTSRRLPLPYRLAEINPSPRTPITSVDRVVFSPDGKRMAALCSFSVQTRRRSASRQRVYVMDLDGRNARATYPHALGDPIMGLPPTAFSPDGRRLSLSIGAKDRMRLWVCNADGTGGRSVMDARLNFPAR